MKGNLVYKRSVVKCKRTGCFIPVPVYIRFVGDNLIPFSIGKPVRNINCIRQRIAGLFFLKEYDVRAIDIVVFSLDGILDSVADQLVIVNGENAIRRIISALIVVDSFGPETIILSG